MNYLHEDPQLSMCQWQRAILLYCTLLQTVQATHHTRVGHFYFFKKLLLTVLYILAKFKYEPMMYINDMPVILDLNSSGMQDEENEQTRLSFFVEEAPAIWSILMP